MKYATLGRMRRLLPFAAGALFAACGEHAPTNPLAAPGQHAASIADARNGGVAGFYFLPPISPALPSYPGTFDATRSPRIEICRWNGAACVGPLVATYSRAANTISLDANAQLYRADWPTVGLAQGVLHRIRVLEGATELGHADAQVPSAGQSPAALTAQGIVPLGNSSRLAIRFRLEVPVVTNGAPVVTITAPANNAVVPSGTPLTLTATAIDPEQGDISSQVIWRSSQLPTPLGTGSSISVTLAGGRHTITASATDAGGLTTTVSIQVVVSIISVPQTLNIPYGGTASLPITLSEPAPAGGLVLTVSSSAPTLVGVSTQTVTIGAGLQSANATLQGVAPGAAVITVSSVDYGSATSQAATTASLNIAQANVSFAQGRTEQITISLESVGVAIAAPPGGIVVTLTSANPACVAATSPVTIPAGLVSTTADLTYGGTATTPCATQVTAAVPSVPSISTDFMTANVQTAPALTVNLGATRVGAGLRAALSSVSLRAPAPVGGVTLTITSSNPAALFVSNGNAGSVGSASATVFVPSGGTSALYYTHGLEGASGTATVNVSAPGYASTTSGAITVAGTVLEFISLPAATTVLTPDILFHVRVGVVNVAGTAFQTEQEVRPGGATMVVTVANSNAAVAQLTTTAGAGQTRTVSIVAGMSRTANSVGTGGIAFDPIGGGSTTLTGTAASALAASQTVTVSAPSLTVNLGSSRIGAGLRGNLSSISLGAPAPTGGLTLTLTSSNATALLVSDGSATSVGATSATVTVAAGATSALFYMHAPEGVTGTGTVSVSAPNYTSATSATVTVAAPAVEFLSLPAATTTLTPDFVFIIRTGVTDVAGTAFQSELEVRPGSSGVVVTVSNSNAAVAQLVTTAGSAQTRTVTIAAGSSRSSGSLAGGGIAFDPLGAGSTTVGGTSPGWLSDNQLVTVSAPTLTVNAGSARVGAGLRASLGSISLGAPAPVGGLTISLTSSSGSVLLVSDGGAASVGAASATVTVAAGATFALFYIHGADNASGTATVSASAPSYTTGTSVTITVAAAAVEFLSLPAATTTLTPDIAFVVRVGVSDVAGSGFHSEQEVRPGASALTVTVSNSNAAVGQLVNTAGAGQTRTVSIAVGASRSPSTVAGGGIAFDPLGTGMTTVGGSAPGLVSTSDVVTVSAPALTVNLGSTRVGAGLRSSLGSISLGAPAPSGGLTLSLTSSNGGVLLVSDGNGASVGAASATITVAAGATFALFYMHGVEGTSGTAVVTASAPGFTNGTGSPTVATAAIEVLALPSSVQAGAANTAFLIRVGASDVAGNALHSEQDVRPGGSAIVVTVTNSNAAVAQLITTAGSAQSRTVTIAIGSARSPNTVAGGGIAFDPLSVGSTNVATSATGVIAVGPNTVSVTP